MDIGNIYLSDFNGDGIPEIAYNVYSRFSHGGNFSYIYLYKGKSDYHYESWYVWDYYNKSSYLIFGDWNRDGVEDLFLNLQTVFFLFNYLRPKELSFDYSQTHFDPTYSSPTCKGDFNGDNYLDVLFTSYDQSFMLWGDGTGNFKPIDIHFPQDFNWDWIYPKGRYNLNHQGFAVADFNRDHKDDFTFSPPNSVRIFYGSDDQSNPLTESRTINLPFTPINQAVIDLNEDQNADLLVSSATEFIGLINDGQGNFTTQSVKIEDSFTPPNVLVADFDQDGIEDLLSWNGGALTLFLGKGKAEFQKNQVINIPYVKDLFKVFVVDMNHDKRLDIFVFPVNAQAVILLNHAISVTPTPTRILPTPTPAFTPLPTLTPTIIPSISGAIVIAPQDNLVQTLLRSPNNVTIEIPSGNYDLMNTSAEFTNKISNKDFYLYCKDPNNRAVLNGCFLFINCIVKIQNMVFNPYPSIYPALKLDNCDATLTNVCIKGSKDLDNRPLYYFYSGPSFWFMNAIQKYLQLNKCQIEPGDSGVNIEIRNCRDTKIQIEQSPSLGVKNLAANVNIVSCSNLEILFDTLDSVADTHLTGCQIEQSSVNLNQGRIRALDGDPGVIGGDGDNALTVMNGSTVILDRMELFGGLGGDGIRRGNDGKPYIVDETSKVIWKTAIRNFRLFDHE